MEVGAWYRRSSRCELGVYNPFSSCIATAEEYHSPPPSTWYEYGEHAHALLGHSPSIPGLGQA